MLSTAWLRPALEFFIDAKGIVNLAAGKRQFGIDFVYVLRVPADFAKQGLNYPLLNSHFLKGAEVPLENFVKDNPESVT